MADDDQDDVTYTELSDAAHIIQRPDAYVGSTHPANETVWILDETSWPPASSKPVSKPTIEPDGPTTTTTKTDDADDVDEPPTPQTPVPPTPTSTIDIAADEPPTDASDETKQAAATDDDNDNDDKPAESMPPPKSKKKQPLKRTARFVQKTIDYTPAFLKVFDEILVNAADARERSKLTTAVRVTIDAGTGEISVWNNGPGIATAKDEKSGLWNAELIFGRMRTGGNFDDSKQRYGGGRNGFGAKLTNAFAVRFTVETYDSKRGLLYRQTWRDNLTIKNDATVKKASKKESYVKISWIPDYDRFSMRKGLDDDTVALLKRRVFDIAGTKPGLKVSLNGCRIDIKTFRDYMACFDLPDESTRIYERCGEYWQVGFSTSGGDDLEAMSFVNGIHTSEGGEHVAHVLDQVVPAIQAAAQSKVKGCKITPTMVRKRLFVFVNSLIVNPAFHTQSKTKLVTKKSDFGSTCTVSPSTIKKLVNRSSGIVAALVEDAELRGNAKLKKTDGRKTGTVRVPKLEDATQAGKAESALCTLVLTEGDSAKAMVMSGLSIEDRRYFGVFPLRGKPINVRDAAITTLEKNAEFGYIKQILGLQQNGDYETVDKLRYGRIMVAADQDTDGTHIKGLVTNIFARFWPKLLQIPDFISQFRTPVVKATKNGGRRSKQQQQVVFFSVPDYTAWKAANNNGVGWTIKYYKGLGTSGKDEAKQYFDNLDQHRIEFEPATSEDFKTLQMAFDKKQSHSRKNWIAAHKLDAGINHAALTTMSYTDFVNKELVLFALTANARAIPSLVDGLKPGQRKIIWSAFRKKLTREIKVAALCGYVMEQAAYHHGEASLNGTIINLAQDFVGANNLQLLEGSGMFGTRAELGDDAASPRYISTYLAPTTRLIYPLADDPILEYLDDDGQPIEPNYFLPVIPMVLANGASGLGFGWSTNVPAFNPAELSANIRGLIKNQPFVPMQPWTRGFRGTIKPNPKKPTDYVATGVATKIGSSIVRIDEIGLDKSLTAYQAFLDQLRDDGKITKFENETADEIVRYVVHMNETQMAAAERTGFVAFFKLASRIPTTNMVLFNSEGQLKRYANVEQIIRDFFDFRLPKFDVRKDAQLKLLQRQLNLLDNKARFITEVVAERINVRVPKLDLLRKLAADGYDLIPKAKTADKQPTKKSVSDDDTNKTAETDDNTDEPETDDETPAKKLYAGYAYLVDLPLLALTDERVAAIRADHAAKKAEVEKLAALSARELWLADLDAFDAALAESDRKRTADAALSTGNRRKSKAANDRKKASVPKNIPKKKRTKLVADTDSEDDRSVPGTKSDYDDDEDRPKKPNGKAAKTTAESTPKKRPVKRTKSDDTDDDDDKKPAGKRSKPTVSAKKRSKPDDDDDDVDRKQPAGKRPKSTGTTAKRKAVDDDNDDDDDGKKPAGKRSKPMLKPKSTSSKSAESKTKPAEPKPKPAEPKPKPAEPKASKRKPADDDPTDDDDDDRPSKRARPAPSSEPADD